MSDPVGEEYLRYIESLSLESKTERRIIFLNLLDFSTVVLHQAGEAYFENLSVSGFQDPARVLEYWNTVTNALERVMDVGVPSEYQKYCGFLESRRDRIAHDVTEGISKEDLDKLVSTAPEWRGWLISQGEKYYETIEELGAEELLVSQLRQDLETIISADLNLSPAFKGEIDNIQSQAQKVQKRLAEMDPDTVTVSSGLADVILEIDSLNREFDRLESEKLEKQIVETWEPIDAQIRKYSGQTVEVEFENGGSMKLDLEEVSQNHTKPLNTGVDPLADSDLPHLLRNDEPHTPVFLEVVDPRDGSSDVIGEIKSVTKI